MVEEQLELELRPYEELRETVQALEAEIERMQRKIKFVEMDVKARDNLIEMLSHNKW